jgi:tetratricopeptide (TPR) repeat protein
MIVWAANFSHAHKSALDTSMALANLAAASLDAELLLIEAKQDQNDIFPKTETYAVVLQSIPAIFRLEREGFLSAGHRLERAVAMDRESSLAHSWFALWHLFLVGQGWAQQPYQSLTQAGQAARRAMLIDPKDARAVAIAGHVKAYLGKKLREALALHEHAIELNPALPLAWHFAGVAQAYVGNHDVAYRQISRCLELAPSDPHGFFAEGAMCIVHFLRRDYEAAVALGRRVTARHPHFRSVHVAFLAALGQAGYTGEATYVRERLLAIDAHFSLRRFRLSAPFQRPADLEHFVSGLRLGGIV